MTILLDIDGILVTEPSWKKVEIHPDGFMQFDQKASENLALILLETKANIVLTTTHRINYTVGKWKEIFTARGFYINEISKINEAGSIPEIKRRVEEISDWVDSNQSIQNFVIIDDDNSLNDLPVAIKKRWVAVKSTEGISDDDRQLAIGILNNLASD